MTRLLVMFLRCFNYSDNTGLFLSRYYKDYGFKNFLRYLKGVLFDTMVTGTYLRKRTLRKLGFEPRLQITITPLAKCNLTCKGCYAADYEHEDELDADTVTRIVREGRKLGIRSFAMMGGEPLLWDGLFKVFSDNPKVFFTMVTNGTLIDKDIVKRMKEVGNIFPFISIDGFREQNDRWRGEGVFNRIMESMDMLKDARVPFGFSVTATKYNFDEVTSDEFFDFLIEKGAYHGAYSPWGPAGRNPGFDNLLTEDERNELFSRLNKLEKTRPILIHKEGYNDGTPLNHGCSAGTVVNILPNGDVEPCVAIHFTAGNIYKNSLTEIFKNPFLTAIREHTGKDPTHKCISLYYTEDIVDCTKCHEIKPTHAEVPCQMSSYIAHLKKSASTENI